MTDQSSIYDLYDGTPPHEASLTSLHAALEIEPDLNILQARVLGMIRNYPGSGMTDEEIANRLHMNPSTARPRRRELQLKGLIKAQGTRPGRSGRQMKVWVPTDV